MGTLYLVSTPIGNLEDITIRAIRTLFTVDVVACEDTRRTGLLLQELRTRYPEAIPHGHVTTPKLLRFDENTEDTEVPDLIELLKDGCDVALVSDAGTPLINDPGYMLVRESQKRGITVSPIPGASAVLAALVSSGMPIHSFTYLGYPPEKQGPRVKLFQSIISMQQIIDQTYVFYCAPHKLVQTLEDMKEVFGDIEITLARELTKVHEEIYKGTISEALAKDTLSKGELVLLFNKVSANNRR